MPPPDWSTMSDNVCIGRETPTDDKDNGVARANKFWAPHKFAQCTDNSCEDSLSDNAPSRMISVGSYQVNDPDYVGYQEPVNVHTSPVSNESKSPPPYPAMNPQNLGGSAHVNTMAEMYNQFVAHDPQFRPMETVSCCFAFDFWVYF